MAGNDDKSVQPRSAWAPLEHRAFALLWTATLVSNIGTWMHDVSAAWLMTSLSPSPFVVALVQAATTAAMAFFALPAGALADLCDRRRLLIWVTVAKAALAVLLAVLTLTGMVTAWSLLAVTFLLGVGSALMAPAWQAVVPSLVPRQDLKPAVALNSLGINIARAIGPMLGGLLIVAAGSAAAFFANAASELFILAALLLWRPADRKPQQRPEYFLPAIAAGIRYAGNSRPLKSVLWRAAAFFTFASAFWALVPLVARTTLGGDAALYGLIVGAVGVGAVAGAIAMPRIDKSAGPDALVRLGTFGMALVLVALVLLPFRAAALIAGLVAGVSWICVLSSLNVAAQNALPDWVRGRGLSIYGFVFFGAMTVGAILWGALASWLGIGPALLTAAAGLAATVPLVGHKRIERNAQDLSPAGHWPEPVLAVPIEDDKGPVMVTVDYVIDHSRQADFIAAVHRLGEERRRDGAFQWGVMQDLSDPARFTEYFLVESWAEHERHHARVTRTDADLQAEVQAFHIGPSAPVVRHMAAAEPASG